jgi:preprotein translocase subunit YajC
MSSSLFAVLFAQTTNAAAGAAATAAPDPSSAPSFTPMLYMVVIVAMVYFAMIRPQSQAKKKQEETIKAAKTGDQIITSSGIHGMITNVKETTVIVRVADNVKLEIEKSHIDKVVRAEAAKSEKVVTAKA